jgi:hypothetical protein
MTNKDTALVNIQTGEVLAPPPEEEIIRPESSIDALLAQFRGGSLLPLHLIMLQKLGLDPEQLEAVVSAYAQEPLLFDKVVNMTLPVHGMLIYQHGGHKGKDGLYHPEGYYQVRFLIELKGELQVVVSSSPSLMEVVASVINHRGGGLFASPIEYLFSKGVDKRHRIYNKSVALTPALLKGKKS